MPRRRQRFADLERQFRESGGTAAPGSRLAGYIDFKKGINTIEVTKKLTSAQRKRYGFAILPFGVTPEDSTPTRYAAAITAYSNTGRIALNVTNSKAGYETIDGSTEQSENFYPALLRVFVKSSDTKTNPISGITKKKYSRTPGSSFSFPFGRTLTTVTDSKTGATESTIDKVDAEDVRKSLSNFVKTQPNVTSVSYEPEVFRIGKQDLVSPSA
ncbi:hypothetical protein [uncultured Nostoc sp.]|uniref:hypothetical protein n=1 Tax=uncultured Nostoc sp. TaxID=340711 RepID=UPI0035CB26E3